MPRIAIAALGNSIMGDDGVGPRILDELRHTSVPDAVTLLDLGTPGLALFSFLAGYDAVILIDAVYDALPAGSVRTYTKEELLALAAGPRLSPHAPAVGEALALAQLEGTAPGKLVLVGVVPQDCAMGECLSPAVAAAVPRAAARIREIVASLSPL